MRFAAPPLEARFVRRWQRFFAEVELASGERVVAHCPNTGSLVGCLVPGAPAWLRDSGNPARKLRFTWQAVRVGGAWVNVDTSLPNVAVVEALVAGGVPELAGYARLRREVAVGARGARGLASRLDVLLEDDVRGTCHVEVKCTTWAENGVAAFPDAVTARGTRHLAELARLARSGKRAVQLFCVSRGDVDAFRPADEVDPEYGRALRRAAAAGVEVLAFRTRVAPDAFELAAPLPVDLAPPRRQRAPPARTRSSTGSRLAK